MPSFDWSKDYNATSLTEKGHMGYIHEEPRQIQSFPSKYVAQVQIYGRMKDEPQSDQHSDPLNPTVSESMERGIHIP